jgi:hypothetical protein
MNQFGHDARCDSVVHAEVNNNSNITLSPCCINLAMTGDPGILQVLRIIRGPCHRCICLLLSPQLSAAVCTAGTPPWIADFHGFLYSHWSLKCSQHAAHVSFSLYHAHSRLSSLLRAHRNSREVLNYSQISNWRQTVPGPMSRG